MEPFDLNPAVCIPLISLCFLTWRKSSRRWRRCWITYQVCRRSTVGFMTSPADIIASSGTTPPTTRTPCATWAAWTSKTFQVRNDTVLKRFIPPIRGSDLCSLLHRNREAGEGLHTGPGWTLRRGSLQLWRAGEVWFSSCSHLREAVVTNTCLSLQLMHPVLESLRNTDKQWLIDTLYAFNAGNVEKFQGFKSAWGQQVRITQQVSDSQNFFPL